MVWVPPVEEESYLLIGKVIVRWGFLEKAFNDFIQRMLTASSTTPPHKRWRKVLKLDQRLELFIDLANLCFSKYPEIETELATIKAKMEQIQIDRDILSHGEIGLLWPIGVLHVRGLRAKKEIERFYNLADLISVVEGVTELCGRFQRLVNESEHDQYRWSPQELSALRDFLTRSH